MNTAEADDDADDPGALAAVGCLRAISTILESVSRLPHLFVQVEPTLLPIMRRMLTTDGQGLDDTYFPLSCMPSTSVKSCLKVSLLPCLPKCWGHCYLFEQAAVDESKLHAINFVNSAYCSCF